MTQLLTSNQYSYILTCHTEYVHTYFDALSDCIKASVEPYYKAYAQLDRWPYAQAYICFCSSLECICSKINSDLWMQCCLEYAFEHDRKVYLTTDSKRYGFYSGLAVNHRIETSIDGNQFVRVGAQHIKIKFDEILKIVIS